MHIGLIGGIGPAATEFYYRGLVERHARSDTRLELTIVQADLRELARNIGDRRAREQADIFAGLVERLAAAGADVAAVTSMGGHFCIGELEAVSTLPILNAIPAVDAAIRQQHLRTIGILGTRMVMETKLYGGITSARVVLPAGDELEQVHTSYVGLAMAARVTDAQRRTLLAAGERLCREQGAEAVLLAGTDMFLAFQGQDFSFPILDCAEAHVEALYRWSSGAA